jgi:hypothetical protein
MVVIYQINHFFSECFENFQNFLENKINELAKKIIQSAFYCGFKVLPLKTIEERERLLTERFEVFLLPCEVEARLLRSASAQRTGNIVVICLNTTYLDHHPHHYLPFLENGADVLLWNPGGDVTPKHYEADLLKVLQAVHAEKPEATLALKTYCANTDPAISAASQCDFPVHLMVDRGHGDACALARSITLFAGCRWVEKILEKDFVCGGLQKIEQIRGRILFMRPQGGDQMMDDKRENFTAQLAQRVGGVVEWIPGDHWSKWGKTAYGHAFRFLRSVGIVSDEQINEGQYPDPLPPSFFKQHCLPYLIKTAC